MPCCEILYSFSGPSVSSLGLVAGLPLFDLVVSLYGFYECRLGVSLP